MQCTESKPQNLKHLFPFPGKINLFHHINPSLIEEMFNILKINRYGQLDRHQVQLSNKKTFSLINHDIQNLTESKTESKLEIHMKKTIEKCSLIFWNSSMETSVERENISFRKLIRSILIRNNLNFFKEHDKWNHQVLRYSKTNVFNDIIITM